MSARSLGPNFARCLVWVEAGRDVGERRDLECSLRDSGGWHVTLGAWASDGIQPLRIDTGSGTTIEAAAEQALELAAVPDPPAAHQAAEVAS